MNVCKGCGTDIPPSRGGRERLWCSNRCRKNQYDRVCARCGGRASGTDPGRVTTDLCDSCYRADQHETAVAWLVAEIHHWNDLYGNPPGAYDWARPAELRYRQRAYAEGRASGRPADATIREVARRHHDAGPWPSVHTTQQVFGSWNAAIEAAGFTPLGVGKKRKVAAW